MTRAITNKNDLFLGELSKKLPMMNLVQLMDDSPYEYPPRILFWFTLKDNMAREKYSSMPSESEILDGIVSLLQESTSSLVVQDPADRIQNAERILKSAGLEEFPAWAMYEALENWLHFVLVRQPNPTREQEQQIAKLKTILENLPATNQQATKLWFSQMDVESLRQDLKNVIRSLEIYIEGAKPSTGGKPRQPQIDYATLLLGIYAAKNNVSTTAVFLCFSRMLDELLKVFTLSAKVAKPNHEPESLRKRLSRIRATISPLLDESPKRNTPFRPNIALA